MLDELKCPASEAAAGFPDHPHRGFETCSIMISGKMEHKDSRGNHVRQSPLHVQHLAFPEHVNAPHQHQTTSVYVIVATACSNVTLSTQTLASIFCARHAVLRDAWMLALSDIVRAHE
jgi:hypothetical protein